MTRGLMFSINGFIYSETQKPFCLEVCCCYVRHKETTKQTKDFESFMSQRDHKAYGLRTISTLTMHCYKPITKTDMILMEHQKGDPLPLVLPSMTSLASLILEAKKWLPPASGWFATITFLCASFTFSAGTFSLCVVFNHKHTHFKNNVHFPQ